MGPPPQPETHASIVESIEDRLATAVPLSVSPDAGVETDLERLAQIRSLKDAVVLSHMELEGLRGDHAKPLSELMSKVKGCSIHDLHDRADHLDSSVLLLRLSMRSTRFRSDICLCPLASDLQQLRASQHRSQ